MSTTIAFYDEFWAAIKGPPPASAPVPDPPQPGDAYEAFVATADV